MVAVLISDIWLVQIIFQAARAGAIGMLSKQNCESVFWAVVVADVADENLHQQGFETHDDVPLAQAGCI